MNTPAMEGYVINSEDIGFRLDKWNLKEYPILLVTGHSGSGKTTIARQIALQRGAMMVELDWFDNYFKYPKSPRDDNYEAWKLFTDCIVEAHNDAPADTRKLGHVARTSLIKKTWMIFTEKVRQQKKLAVCEGLQVVSLMAAFRDPFIWPCIIKGTSAVVSAIRRKDRDGKIIMDGKKYCFLEIVVLWLGQEPQYKAFMSQQLATGRPMNPDVLL